MKRDDVVMKRRLWSYVLTAVILLVGAVALGFPVAVVWIPGFVGVGLMMAIFTLHAMYDMDAGDRRRPEPRAAICRRPTGGGASPPHATRLTARRDVM